VLKTKDLLWLIWNRKGWYSAGRSGAIYIDDLDDVPSTRVLQYRKERRRCNRQVRAFRRINRSHKGTSGRDKRRI